MSTLSPLPPTKLSFFSPLNPSLKYYFFKENLGTQPDVRIAADYSDLNVKKEQIELKIIFPVFCNPQCSILHYKHKSNIHSATQEDSVGFDLCVLGSSDHVVISVGTFGMWGALLSPGHVIAAKGTSNITYSAVHTGCPKESFSS